MSVFAWANSLASDGRVSDHPYALALRAHESMPAGRVVDNLHARRDDAVDRKALTRREQNARYRAKKRAQAAALGVSVRAVMGITTR